MADPKEFPGWTIQRDEFGWIARYGDYWISDGPNSGSICLPMFFEGPLPHTSEVMEELRRLVDEDRPESEKELDRIYNEVRGAKP